MRGVTARTAKAQQPGAALAVPARRRGTLVASLVLLLLAIMIVRDIVVRRWTGSPAAPPDVTRQR
ncbi:hypothetical protein [Bradyrhizobium sp. SZCCHNS1054]|uniref:hypothetical protein n=1 Tax=Bradyrhizobium sp. SZCCHNS1054 TaxID=3057301 RepID=UPI0029163FBB|nr:hypothetical protein [Bradyrhizobium sp. SZCCHNS1054]